MKLIELNKKHYHFPSNWNELDQQKLLQLMQVMFLKNYKAEGILVHMIRVLSGISNFQFLRTKADELEQYLYLLVPFLQQDIEFTKNHIPSYSVKGTALTFYGPDDECSNIRMKEFTFLENLFVQWIQTKREDVTLLNELVAILYRPAPEGYDLQRNPEGDRRMPFNQNISAYHAKHFIAKWPPSVKLAIAYWYGGCRSAIIDNYSDLFDPAQASKASAGEAGLLSVMLSVAEGGIFGPFKEVEEQYVNLVLTQLKDSVLKAKALTQKP